MTGETDHTRIYLELYQKAGANFEGMLVNAFIDPHKHEEQPKPRPTSYKHKPASIGDMLMEIELRSRFSNAYGHPALINPNFQTSGHSKASDADVLCRLGLVLDGDTDNGKPAKLIDGIEPSLIIQTSLENQQIHYVFSRPLTVEEFRELAELAYRKCGGDPCCKVPSQLFRIPGTLNHPDYKKIARGRDPAPYPVSIDGGSQQLIDPDELRKALEAMPDLDPRTTLPSDNAGGGRGVDVGDIDPEKVLEKIPERVRDLMKLAAGPDGDRSAYCYNVMCFLFEAGLSDAEIYAVGHIAPFAAKFAQRGGLVQEIARCRTRWQKKREALSEGHESFNRMVERAGAAGKVVQLKRASQLSPDEEAFDEAAEDEALPEELDDQPKRKRKTKEEKEAEAAARKKANEDALDEAEALTEAFAEEHGISPLPRGYRYALDKRDQPLKIEYYVETKEDAYWVFLCSAVKFKAVTRNIEGKGWGLLAQIKTLRGDWNEIVISQALTVDHKAFFGPVIDQGLVCPIRNRPKFLDLVTFAAFAVKNFMHCTPGIGWHEMPDGRDPFVLPDQTFGDAETNPIVYQGRENIYAVRGTLEGWRQDIASLAIGNSRIAFSISAAFAGPLLKLMDMESGGIHFRGNSSSGKSTATYAAVSVWSRPEFFTTWRKTDNSLEGIATAHCDALLVLDELAQIDAKAAAQAAYMLANGEGKGRMNPDATMKKTAKWRVLFLSTGEISLSDKMAEAGIRTTAGQEVRILDISADAGRGRGIFEELHGFEDGKKLSEAIKARRAKHYGRPAREFLKKLTADLDGALEKIRAHMDAFEAFACPANADGQVKRALGRFALVAAAGELATEWGITGWPENEATRAAEKCFEGWLDGRGGAGPQEMMTALSRVRSVIELHGASRFQNWHENQVSTKSPSGGAVINQLGFAKPDENEYCFFPEVFKTEVCKGLDVNVMCKALRQIGALDSDYRKNQKSCRIPGIGKRKLYVIKADRLFDTGDASC